MLELQERPAAEQPTAGRPAGEQPRSVGGLASRSKDEAVPRRQTRPRAAIPWSGSQQRSLAWANLVTVVLMVMAGVGTATGVKPLEAPAAVGRLVQSTLFGHPEASMAKAKAAGLSHLYVRTGSSWDGFYAAPFLDKLLPAAHAADLKVYGWDFPRLISWTDDVTRAKAAVDHRTPGKQRIDGFAADIETRSEGTLISAQAAADYGRALR